MLLGCGAWLCCVAVGADGPSPPPTQNSGSSLICSTEACALSPGAPALGAQALGAGIGHRVHPHPAQKTVGWELPLLGDTLEVIADIPWVAVQWGGPPRPCAGQSQAGPVVGAWTDRSLSPASGLPEIFWRLCVLTLLRHRDSNSISLPRTGGQATQL